jgi:WD40 repeat protein
MKLILILIIILSATTLQAQSVFVGGDSDTLWYHDTGKNVQEVKFSPDDEYLAVAMREYSPVQLFNVANGELVKSFDNTLGDSFRAVAFSNDSKLLFATGYNIQEPSTKIELVLEVYDVETGKRIINLLDYYSNEFGYNDGMDIELSPDGSMLAVALSKDGEFGMIIFNTQTWEIIHETEHNICKIEFFPIKNKLLVNNSGNNYSILDLETFKYESIDYSGQLHDDFDISPDGKYLYIVSYNDQVNIVYDLETLKEIKRFNVEGSTSTHINASAYENLVVTDVYGINPEDNKTKIYNTKDLKSIYSYDWAPQQAMSISNNQKYIASSTKKIFIYNARWQGTDVVEENPDDNIIYPNPAGDQVILKINSDTYELAQINLYGAIGTNNLEFNFQLNIGINEIPLDIAELTSGTYLINIATNSFSKTYKLIKE